MLLDLAWSGRVITAGCKGDIEKHFLYLISVNYLDFERTRHLLNQSFNLDCWFCESFLLRIQCDSLVVFGRVVLACFWLLPLGISIHWLLSSLSNWDLYVACAG